LATLCADHAPVTEATAAGLKGEQLANYRADAPSRERPASEEAYLDGSADPVLTGDTALSLKRLRNERLTRAVQIMTTEHFTLQGARANTVAETNGRIAVFLSTVASTLIAVAFVGQMSSLGLPFQVVTLILLPTLLFLGAATFGRVLQSSIEDYLYLGGINRVHHFYTEVLPELREHFVLSPYDDWRGHMRSIGVVPSRWQILLTGTTVVGGINSVLAGTLAGLLANWLMVWSLPLSTAAGVTVFVISALLHSRWTSAQWQTFGKTMRPRFPTPHS
jgi:hypothetical protein